MTAFDGVSGWFAARAMERMNADAEREAVDKFAPKPDDRVLVVGFGPGIGLQCLLRHPVAEVVGVDPSAMMVRIASRRNAGDIERERLVLVQGTVAELDPAFGGFDGAIAVHTIQMCRPFAPTAEKLGRILRHGARLVTITHAWAAEKDFDSKDRFVATVCEGLSHAGFAQVTWGHGKAERGTSILIEAIR